MHENQCQGVIRMMKLAMTWVQPAFLAVIFAFWSLAPASWINASTMTLAVLLTYGAVQALEFVSERHASWRITWREFRTDFFYLLLFTFVIAWFTQIAAENPLTALKASLGIATPWLMALPFVVQVAFVLVVIEFGQYWMHRLMHGNYAFWLTHAPHHHMTQLNALKGATGNPIELFLISLSVVALLDVQLAAVFCASNMLTGITCFAHANVKTTPPRWYSYLFTTIEHHSLHHSTLFENNFSNFGNGLILLDRIFGTYREGYSEIVGQDERKRLSIWEQWVFPAKHGIPVLKAKLAGGLPSTN
jgi:sterol desaturase/sphingolipid hydroxylase (fatty acid hydroxylase superfamily)